MAEKGVLSPKMLGVPEGTKGDPGPTMLNYQIHEDPSFDYSTDYISKKMGFSSGVEHDSAQWVTFEFLG